MSLTPEQLQRIQAAREEARRCIASDTLILIHPFDLATLLKQPTVIDVCVVNIDNRQYVVVDGAVFRCTPDVKNQTPLSEMLAK